MAMQGMRRWTTRAVVVLAVLLIAVVLLAWGVLRASLPKLDGELLLAGLREPVTVERDGQGVPTLTGDDRLDLARATGFLHAQDRFFQMDLLRRAAAGELAGLVGAAALPLDRKVAPEQLRAVATRGLADAQPPIRALLEAYAEGVNAGLGELGARPFEYWMLRTEPQLWQAQDSLLVALSMFMDLTDRTARKERDDAVLRRVLGDEAAAFLAPQGGPWDAPLLGEPLPAPVVPSAAQWTASVGESLAAVTPLEPLRGSNNWAVSGRLTPHGGAIVADDMHLGLGLPNIWYRVRLHLRGASGFDITGVTLPGLPAIIAGSNGHIAWGFTNSYGDYSDIVTLAPEQIETLRLELPVQGGEPEVLTVRTSAFGPVHHDPLLGDYAVQWTARVPGGLNLNLLLMEQVQSVDEAIAVAHRAGIPPQNMMIAGADGRIAWTIAGRIPVRRGFSGDRPALRTDAIGWDGWLPDDAVPRIVAPDSGRLWTANARTVSGEALARVGNGGYALGARAGQIRDDLFARDAHDEASMHDIVLDDRALFLERWRRLMLAQLPDGDAAGALLREEGMRASVDDAGYPLVRAFHNAVTDRVWTALTAPVREAVPDIPVRRSHQFEHALWALIEQRPAHLLPAGVADWDALLSEVARQVIDSAKADGPLAEQTWGEANRAEIEHPLAGFLPSWLGRHLKAPAVPQAGDRDMPRVARPGFGASERFAVSPGHEAAGYFTMPGGQSGHPLSPWFLAGFQDWAEGRRAPFLPGTTEHQLILTP